MMKDIQLYIDGETLTPQDVVNLDLQDLPRTHASPALMMFAQRIGESVFRMWGIPSTLTMETLLVAIQILVEKRIVLEGTDCIAGAKHDSPVAEYDMDLVRKLLDFEQDTEWTENTLKP